MAQNSVLECRNENVCRINTYKNYICHNKHCELNNNNIPNRTKLNNINSDILESNYM